MRMRANSEGPLTINDMLAATGGLKRKKTWIRNELRPSLNKSGAREISIGDQEQDIKARSGLIGEKGLRRKANFKRG